MTPSIQAIADINPGVMYSLSELAPTIKVSVTTLWRETNAGRLPSTRVGNRLRRVLGADFLAYVEAGKLRPAEKPQGQKKSAPQRQQPRPFQQLDSARLREAWSREE